MAYSHKYLLYCIVTSDFKFVFMNELNNIIKPSLEMSHLRLVNHVQFYDEKDLIITAGNEGVYIFKFDYRGKYGAKLAGQVDPNGVYISIKLLEKTPVQERFLWVKGLKLNTKSKIIISWDWEIVGINQLSSKGQLISQFHNLVDAPGQQKTSVGPSPINTMDEKNSTPEKILDVIVFTDFRYFVTSTTLGNIYVFKYVTDGQVETQRRLIHTFDGHYKAVPSICSFEHRP